MQFIQLLGFGQGDGVQQSLAGRFVEAVFARVRSLFIVLLDPHIQVLVEFFQGGVHFFTEDHAVEFILHGAMKTFADTVGLRTTHLGLGMVNILDDQEQFVLVILRLADILGAAIGQHAK